MSTTRRRDHYTSATSEPRTVWKPAAKLGRPTPATSTTFTIHCTALCGPVVPNFCEPNSAHLQRYSGRQPTRLSGPAELCAVLGTGSDAQVHYLPFGSNPFSSAATLPKEVAY